MNKWIRIGIITLIVAALGIGGVYYYNKFMNKKEIVISEIYKFIPTDAALIIESKNISNLSNALNHSSKPWSLLVNIQEIDEVNKQICYIDSIFRNHPVFKFNSNKGPVILSFHPSGKKDLNMLLIVNFGNNSNAFNAKAVIQDIFKNKATITEKIYNEETIYSVLSDGNSYLQSFHFCFTQGLFIAANSSLMIENVIRQMHSNYSLFDNPSFEKVLKTSGQNVEANIFINHKLFPRIWKNWISNDIQKSAIMKQTIADWSAIDLHVSQNMFLLNGFIDHGDSLVNYLKLFSNQEQVSFSIPEILPKESHTFLFLSMNPFKSWQEGYETFLESYGLKNTREANLNAIKKKTTIDLLKLFNELIYRECGLAYASTPESNDSLNSNDVFFIVNTDNQSTAKSILDSVLINYAQLKGTKLSDYETTIKLDNDLNVSANVFPVENAPELLFGKYFSQAKAKYYTFIDNYLVFSRSKKALQRIIYANSLKKTLQNEPLYRSYTDMLDRQSNMLFYCDIAQAKTFLREVLNPTLFKVILENFDVIRQMDAFSCQLSNNNNMIYTSLYFRYSPEIKENTHTVWESKLDTTISMKPVFVINHNTQEKEIFVQDNANTIYLLNNSGRILWKNNIPEKIMSEVFQIDMMKNKRLQYLFSTKNYIYLVDRNGEIIENFHIKLKSPATNGINYITYNNKESRIFVACKDKKVYCYTLAGKIDKTWKFESTNHYLYQPVQYVFYDKKDHLFFADSLNFYILNKEGKVSVPVSQHIPVNHNAMLYFEPKNPETEARFVIDDIHGNICFIGIDGKMKTLRLEERNPDHFFLYNDMDGDGYPDYIFVDGEDLTIYSRSKKVMLTYSLPSEVSFKPIYYEFPMAKHKIGLVCNGSLLLIDKDGKMPNSFPLKGISPFSISQFIAPIKTYFLVAGSNNGYVLNYEVFK